MFWVLDVLDSYHAAEKNVLGSVCAAGRHNTWTIDEVDAFHESDVLPYFGFPRNWGYCADFLFTEGVDNGGLPGVWVSDKADRYLLAFCVEGGKLTEELDEGTFAKRVCD